MLSKELLGFYRAQRFDYNIQTVGDDVYDWLVDLGSFDPASALAKARRGARGGPGERGGLGNGPDCAHPSLGAWR